jgi:hypothetical protein
MKKDIDEFQVLLVKQQKQKFKAGHTIVAFKGW